MWFGTVKELNKSFSQLIPDQPRPRRSSPGRPPRITSNEIDQFDVRSWYARITNLNWDEPASDFSLTEESANWICKVETEPDSLYGKWLAGVLDGLPDSIDGFSFSAYVQWLKEVLCDVDDHQKEAVIRISSSGAPLQLSFIMVYLYLVWTIESTNDSAALTGFKAFIRLHGDTKNMLKNVASSFDSYKNRCAGEVQFEALPDFEPLSETHIKRDLLVAIVDTAIQCLSELEEWTSDSFHPDSRSALSNHLRARTLPGFITLCGRLGARMWWTEAQNILQAGADSYLRLHARRTNCTGVDIAVPETDILDFDSDHLRYLGGLSWEEGSHMLFYISIPHYSKHDLSELFIEYLKRDPYYQGRTIE